MIKYDMSLGVSTYRATGPCFRFIQSLPWLTGRKAVFISGPNVNELKFLLESTEKQDNTDIFFIHTDINHLPFSRALGSLVLLQQGLETEYYISCDDDLEFIPESGEILSNLREAPPFALCAFNSSHPMHYPEYDYVSGFWKIGIPWIDGNFIVSKWEDNLKFGFQDSLPEYPLSFYTETEYGWRMKYFTGNDLICNFSEQFYLHHFRNSPLQNMIRKDKFSQGVTSGEMFFQRKFGVYGHFNHSTVHKELWARILPDLESGNEWKIKRHMMYDGLWNDWKAILNKYEGSFRLVGAK